MLLERMNYWTTIQAYQTHPPSRWQLMLARVEWFWLSWQAGADDRRERRAIARLQDASQHLPAHLRRDIGLL